jgi:hypothetical protein
MGQYKLVGGPLDEKTCDTSPDASMVSFAVLPKIKFGHEEVVLSYYGKSHRYIRATIDDEVVYVYKEG